MIKCTCTSELCTSTLRIEPDIHRIVSRDCEGRTVEIYYDANSLVQLIKDTRKALHKLTEDEDDDQKV